MGRGRWPIIACPRYSLGALAEDAKGYSPSGARRRVLLRRMPPHFRAYQPRP